MAAGGGGGLMVVVVVVVWLCGCMLLLWLCGGFGWSAAAGCCCAAARHRADVRGLERRQPLRVCAERVDGGAAIVGGTGRDPFRMVRGEVCRR